jgi:antitoxin MazE
MNAVLKARIIKIGNSRGVRIPKMWLEQLGLKEEIEMAVNSDQIVIRLPHRPRHGWDRQFEVMATHGDDRLLDEATATQWDKKEWKW